MCMTPAVAVFEDAVVGELDRRAADKGSGVERAECFLAGYPREPPKVCVAQSANLIYMLVLTVD